MLHRLLRHTLNQHYLECRMWSGTSDTSIYFIFHILHLFYDEDFPHHDLLLERSYIVMLTSKLQSLAQIPSQAQCHLLEKQESGQCSRERMSPRSSSICSMFADTAVHIECPGFPRLYPLTYQSKGSPQILLPDLHALSFWAKSSPRGLWSFSWQNWWKPSAKGHSLVQHSLGLEG